MTIKLDDYKFQSLVGLFDICVNDGEGDQCGKNYAQRVEMARNKAPLPRWLTLIKRAHRWRFEKYGTVTWSKDMKVIAQKLRAYYINHVKELNDEKNSHTAIRC